MTAERGNRQNVKFLVTKNSALYLYTALYNSVRLFVKTQTEGN